MLQFGVLNEGFYKAFRVTGGFRKLLGVQNKEQACSWGLSGDFHGVVRLCLDWIGNDMGLPLPVGNSHCSRIEKPRWLRLLCSSHYRQHTSQQFHQFIECGSHTLAQPDVKKPLWRLLRLEYLMRDSGVIGGGMRNKSECLWCHNVTVILRFYIATFIY